MSKAKAKPPTKSLPARAKPAPKPKSAPRSKPPPPPTSFPIPPSPIPTASPPLRTHTPAYHHALLLDDADAREKLLGWFEGIYEVRKMPWRKRWVDWGAGVGAARVRDGEGEGEEEGDGEAFEKALEKRAYEVWVSEVMLQQTRVATVIPYFTSWLSAWPSVHDLAAASHDDVLAKWKGLGYYSRATRLWEGAKVVVNSSTSPIPLSPPPSSKTTENEVTKNEVTEKENEKEKQIPPYKCLIPPSALSLQLIPGIGRYTAGAISSIAFGAPEPVLDGNVARVLSRQLGLHVDVKDKRSMDMLWGVADALVKCVAGGVERSERPGLWNQALMELGATVCTAGRPRCGGCVVRGTCRAYGEGEKFVRKEGGKDEIGTRVGEGEEECETCEVLDIEDLGGEDEDEGEKPAKRRKVEKKVVKQANTISNYFTRAGKAKEGAKDEPKVEVEVEIEKEEEEQEEEDDDDDALDTAAPLLPLPLPTTVAPPDVSPAQLKAITTYASLFPKKAPKKKVPEQDAVVCVVEARRADGGSEWMIEQRPAKGLLASLWQFPQHTLPSTSSTPSSRKAAAQTFIASLAGNKATARLKNARHVCEVGSIVHVFTHLKLRMWVVRFVVDLKEEDGDGEVEREEEGGSEGKAGKTGKRKVEGEDGEEKKVRWVETDQVEGETLSTGMRRCWGAVREGL